MKKTILIIILSFHSFIYSQTFDGNLNSNTIRWTTEQKDFNALPRVNVSPMSLRLWDNYGGTNAPSTYGTLMEVSGKVGHLVSQLYFQSTWEGGKIMYRSAFYNQTTWSDWRKLLDSQSDVESSGNLKLTGTGNSYILNGNFGIGTSTTGIHKLAVEGSIGAREIKVQATGWSDFVFKKEYNLPTLEAVEKQINEKGHLKDIPSEEEVLKNGINLGEMNSKLLQKIEELTLYIIQQQKKNDQQSLEIEILKKEKKSFENILERLSLIEQKLN